jgi:hypothetical protein
MPYYEFVWTERALGKISLNGVTQEEVAAVVCDPNVTGYSRSSGRPIAMGPADDGRRIICVYEMLDELRVLPVTSYYLRPKS